MKSNLGQACFCVLQGLQGIKHNELLDSKVMFGDTDAEQVTKLCMQRAFPILLLVTLSLYPTPASAKIHCCLEPSGKIPPTGLMDEATL